MSRTTKDSKAASGFIQYFSLVPINPFDFWVDFARNSLELLNKHNSQYKDKLKKFDSENPDILIPIDGTNHYTSFDGFDYYFDEMLTYSHMESEVLSLAFIGAFKEFEKFFKNYYKQLMHFSEIGIKNPLSKNDKYIHNVKNRLKKENVTSLEINPTLIDIWADIDNYTELRHVLAHNDNPIDISTHPNRLDKLKKINHINISSDNHVSIESIDLIKDVCSVYSNFIENLTKEIANEKFQT